MRSWGIGTRVRYGSLNLFIFYYFYLHTRTLHTDLLGAAIGLTGIGLVLLAVHFYVADYHFVIMSSFVCLFSTMNSCCAAEGGIVADFTSSAVEMNMF